MRQRSGRSAVLALAALFLLLAGTAAYGRSAVLDEARFADRAASTLRSDEVREEIATRAGERVVAKRPELAGGLAVLEQAVAEDVTEDPAFRAAFRAAAARMHRALFADHDANASLVVAGSGAALRRALRDRLPTLAGTVPRIADPPLMSIGSGGREHELRELAPVARDLALPATVVFGVLGFVLLVAGAALSPGWRSAVWGAALAVAAAGGLAAAAVTGARDVVLTHFDTGFGDAVVSQIWAAYLGDLRTWGLAVAAAGLVVAAAAGGPRPSPRTVLAAPTTRHGRALRALGLLGLAALAVRVPELLLHVGLVTLAAGFVYVAAGDLMRVLTPRRLPAPAPRAPAGAASRADSSRPSPRSPSRPRRTW